ncbi:DDE superfamily endonuclease [Hirsutella rhossiliensis]
MLDGLREGWLQRIATDTCIDGLSDNLPLALARPCKKRWVRPTRLVLPWQHFDISPLKVLRPLSPLFEYRLNCRQRVFSTQTNLRGYSLFHTPPREPSSPLAGRLERPYVVPQHHNEPPFLSAKRLLGTKSIEALSRGPSVLWKTHLPEDEDNALVAYIQWMERTGIIGIPAGKEQLEAAANTIRQRRDPSSRPMSQNWLAGWRQSHPEVKKTYLKAVERARKSFEAQSVEEVNDFFSNLDETIKKFRIGASEIWNEDEAGIRIGCLRERVHVLQQLQVVSHWIVARTCHYVLQYEMGSKH